MDIRIASAVLGKMVMDASPIGSLLTIVKEGIRDTASPSDFFCVKDDRLEVLAYLCIQRKVKVNAREDLKERVSRWCEEVLVEKLRSSLQTLDRLNAQHGTSVKCVIPKNPQLAHIHSESLILLDLPHVEINLILPEGGREEDLIQDASERLGAYFNRLLENNNFNVAHQFSHVLHKDNVVLRATQVCGAIVNLFPWIYAWGSPMSWGAYLVYALPKSLGSHILCKMLRSIFVSCAEERAEIEATLSLRAE